jgi:site-specific DNA-adenine methylase
MIARWDQRDTLIYVDPPYMGEHRLTMSKGYRVEAGLDLWPRLVDALLAVERAAVIVSGYPNEDTERLGWRSVPMRHNRTVQARAGGTLEAAPEVLWLNENVPSTRLFEEACA